MSSPGSSLSPASAAAAAAAAAATRKRQQPSVPVYSPNETLNQMTQEAEARQQDKYAVQKEIRAIRAQEMEKQRKEEEEKEREREETMSRFNRPPSSSTSNTPITTVTSKVEWIYDRIEFKNVTFFTGFLYRFYLNTSFSHREPISRRVPQQLFRRLQQASAVVVA